MESENYRIRYTPLAYEDLDEIDTYISAVLLNPQAHGNTAVYYKLMNRFDFS